MDGYAIGDVIPFTITPATEFSTVTAQVRRLSDGWLLDFADNTLKAAGHTTKTVSLAVVGAVWSYLWNSANLADNTGTLTGKRDLLIEYTVDGEKVAEDLSLGYGGGGATAAEVWAELIDGTAARARLSSIDQMTQNIWGEVYRVSYYRGIMSTAVPASLWNGGQPFALTADRTLDVGEYVRLYSIPTTFGLDDVFFGELTSTGFAQDAAWVDATTTTFRRILTSESLLTADTVITVTGTYDASTPFSITYTAREGYNYGAVLRDGTTAGAQGRPALIADGGIAATDVVDGTVTVMQALRAIVAFVAGKTTDGNTSPLTFYRQDGTTAALTFTVDENGTRSVVVKDLS